FNPLTTQIPKMKRLKTPFNMQHNDLLKKDIRMVILAFSFLLVSMFSLSAQTPRKDSGADGPKAISALRVGDHVPKDFWEQKVKIYHKGDTAIIDLKRYKGKPLLLDFWTTWCASCIEGMPKLVDIQNSYNGQMNILLVNPEFSKGNYVRIHGMKSDFLRKNDLTTVFEDSYLTDLLPFAAVPYYVWINANGRIAAGTFAQFVTNEQINSFLKYN